MAATGKQLDIFPQSLKGLCIVCVVLIHLPWGQADNWSGWLWISVRQIINFAVATFFFLSAYYTKPFEELYTAGISEYYKKRFRRIMLPYIFWASIYIIIIPLLTSGQISDYWWYYYLTGKGPTYFLLALAQFTLINPLLQKYKNHKIWNRVFILVTPLYLLFYYCYNIKTGHEFRPEQFFCFPWFICYYLGLKMQDKDLKNRIKSYSFLSIFGFYIGALLLSNIEAFYIYYFTGIYSFAISQITIGSIIYSLVVIVLFNNQWQNDTNRKSILLPSLGDYSMGIFLMHPTFNWIYKFIALHTPGGIVAYSSSIGFTTIHIVVLILSLATSYFVSKFLSTKFPHLTIPLGLK